MITSTMVVVKYKLSDLIAMVILKIYSNYALLLEKKIHY